MMDLGYTMGGVGRGAPFYRLTGHRLTEISGENKLADKMLADLIQGPFKGKKFKFHHTDPKTGERKVMELGG